MPFFHLPVLWPHLIPLYQHLHFRLSLQLCAICSLRRDSSSNITLLPLQAHVHTNTHPFNVCFEYFLPKFFLFHYINEFLLQYPFGMTVCCVWYFTQFTNKKWNLNKLKRKERKAAKRKKRKDEIGKNINKLMNEVKLNLVKFVENRERSDEP